MVHKRNSLVPIGEVFSGLPAPVKAIREATPQARHHFTLADQVNQLVGASEADAERGFMARMMALCSLPRTNPGNQYRYVRQNGPYTLVMSATGINKLPFGNFPRLILAWVCTEGVGCGKGRNDTLRTIQRFCHLYSPVSRMWAQPRGEMCGRNSGTTGRPACLRLATASPSRAVFQ